MANHDAALVLFSGGQDSATCLAWALDRFARVETIGFAYGQRHHIELAMRPVLRDRMAGISAGWASRLGPDHVLDLAGGFAGLGATALTSEAEIGLRADGLPNTFVPGRNLLFLIYAAALADRRSIPVLVGGMCETDFSGYPDCRDQTIRAQQRAIALGFGHPIGIETPLMGLSKQATWALAWVLGGEKLIGIIVEHSHSCYRGDRSHRHDWGYGCGACPACVLRAKGWRAWQDESAGRRAP